MKVVDPNRMPGASCPRTNGSVVVTKLAETTRTQTGTHRLVVQSIGNADVRLVHSLRTVLRRSDRDIAAMLYRAPSELLGGLTRQTAENMKTVLDETGVDITVLPDEATFETGKADHEIAISIDRFDQIDEVVAQLASLIGSTLDDTRKLLCREPAMVLGGVSLATVEAVRRRLAPLGTHVDASHIPTAQFDLFLGPCPPSILRHVTACLESAGVSPTSRDTADQPMLATGLDQPTARNLWEKLSRIGAPIQMVNRDFQRCDVTLDRVADPAPLRTILRDEIGMPDQAIDRIAGHLPVVLLHRITLTEAQDWLKRLAEAGATASAHLLSCRRFSLHVDTLGDVAQTRSILRWLGELSAATCERLMNGRRFECEGPFTHTQARWMVAALRQAGTRARMALR